MSNKVDVLAVMDAVCERAASGDPAEYREVNSLRDAITELIKVADLALGWVNGPTNAEKVMRDRIRATLDRVKGE